MSEYKDFINSILNIKQKYTQNPNEDIYSLLKTIISEEKNIIYKETKDLTGYCKYIATQIYDRLRQENITTYWIELNTVADIDHTILIAEYKKNNEFKRFLIDPTYSQFTKNDKYNLVKLEEWPSEKLDKDILNDLLEIGLTELNSQKFNNYLNSFTNLNDNIDLDEFLHNNLFKRKFKR